MTHPFDNNQDSGSDQNFSSEAGFGNGSTEELMLPPWERRERFGFLNGLYLTIKDVLFAPRQFFHRMPTQIGLREPLYFAIVLGVIAAFFAWMWSLTGSSLQMLVSDNFDEVFAEPFKAFVFFLTSPITIVMLVFLKAGLLHGLLTVLGGNKLGFEATFRVAAYGEAAGILALVPACGSVIGLVWTIVVTVIGLYSIHDTEPWRAAVAVAIVATFCAGAAAMGVVSYMLTS
ncbi:MAG: hypothetical protein ACI9UK_002279 [Candidatus Krumholzibacteriia bacterium]